jgi:hypothetical protein
MNEILVNRVRGACREGGIKTISERFDKPTEEFDGFRVLEPGADGYLHFKRMATGLELEQALNEATSEAGLMTKVEDSWRCHQHGELPRETRLLVCYTATGTNEGYFAFVAAVVDLIEEHRAIFQLVPVLTIKTFAGLDTAFELSELAVQVLEQ